MTHHTQRNILKQLPVLFCEFTADGTLHFVNERYCQFFGCTEKELLGRSLFDFVPPADRPGVRARIRSLTPEHPTVEYTHPVVRPDGTRWVQWRDVVRFDPDTEEPAYHSVGLDITDSRRLEEQERRELAWLRSALKEHLAVILFLDPDTGRIEYANPAASRFYGYGPEELTSMSIQDINLLGEEKVGALRQRAKEAGQHYFTFPHRLKSGQVRMVDVFTSPIRHGGRTVLFSIIVDVTEREDAMKEIKDLAYRDHLTGVHNRRYFEKTFHGMHRSGRSPLAIILADINGLRMVNDHFGTATGDALLRQAVHEIDKRIPQEAILARMGGDEFVVLLAGAQETTVAALSDLLEDELELESTGLGPDDASVYLSVSFGHAVQQTTSDDLDALIHRAERELSRRKINNENSNRSHMIQAMMSTLFQKSPREQKHSERVGLHCEAIARSLGWSIPEVNRMRTAGRLHDIGKIGIEERILNKPGALTKDEWTVMKRHAENSARILERVEDYANLAPVVAAHHERMDGTGYPRGLSGQAIPVHARIIAVADAWDAMTHPRPYRGVLSRSDALRELERGAGRQFDADIVAIFERVLSTPPGE